MTPDEIPEGYIDPKTLTAAQLRGFERQVIAANAIIDQRASMLVDDIEIYRSQLKTLLCDNWDDTRPDLVAKSVREDLDDQQLALLCNLGLYAMQSLMVRFQERQMESFREAAE
jgi:hypothetical protein